MRIGEISLKVWGALRWAWGKVVRWRLIELALVGAIMWMVVADRVRLGNAFLFKYVDEDQGIEWYAAREMLHGRIPEPCFYGQDYNSTVEGMLAAPLVGMKVPYWVAVPTVTVTLSLLPFALLAWAAWRRRQSVMAGLALLVPVVLSTRYGMITGMPRGFVTGVAFAAIPAVLMLPGRRKILEGVEEPELLVAKKSWWRRLLGSLVAGMRYRRTWPKTRYFFVGLVTVVAVTLNPNCAVLLGAVGVYAILTSLLEWRFWVFGVLGIGAGGIYPWYVHQFYYVWHDDYRLYLRERTFTWSWANWHYFLSTMARDRIFTGTSTFNEYVYAPSKRVFDDLMPTKLLNETAELLTNLHKHYPSQVYGWSMRSVAPMALLIVLGVVIVLLLLRWRLAAVVGGLAGLAVVIASFAYDRVDNGGADVSFPVSRMYLAVPVLLVWLMALVTAGPRREWGWTKWFRMNVVVRFTKVWVLPWVWRGALVWMVWVSWTSLEQKRKLLPVVVADEVEDATVARCVPLVEVQAVAKAVQRAADATHATMLVVDRGANGGDGRKLAYVLPELTTCDTVFPSYERRTWLLHENAVPKFDTVLVIAGENSQRFGKGIRGAGRGKTLSEDPAISSYLITGESVVDFCNSMGFQVRMFGERTKGYLGALGH